MEPWAILVLGVVLGALAFFEPCAIASNVLFTQYVQRGSPGDSGSASSDGCGPGPDRSAGRPGACRGASFRARAGVALPEMFLPVAYGLFGVVYVVSRFVYIPVRTSGFTGSFHGAEGAADRRDKAWPHASSMYDPVGRGAPHGSGRDSRTGLLARSRCSSSPFSSRFRRSSIPSGRQRRERSGSSTARPARRRT